MNMIRKPSVTVHAAGSCEPVELAPFIRRHTGDETICYKQADGEKLLLSCFLPARRSAREKVPVLAIIHGGGWASRKIFEDQSGWSGDHLGYLARYYADKGFFSVVITYRLLTEEARRNGRTVLDTYSDCQDALNWVAAHAEQYGADTDRVALMGESAGGHLAAAMATGSFFDSRLPIQTAILVNPITYVVNNGWAKNLLGEAALPGFSRAEAEMLFSPSFRIGYQTSRTLLVHGDADRVVSLEHAKCFNTQMTQFGRSSELHVIEGADHAFLLAEYYRDNDTHTWAGICIIDDYLRRYDMLPGGSNSHI